MNGSSKKWTLVGGGYISFSDKKMGNNPIGKTLVDSHGEELGIVSDVIFDEKDGEIEGLEISKGLIDDLFMGRQILSGYIPPASKENVLLIPSSDHMELKTNNGGILKLISKSNGSRQNDNKI